MTSRRGRLIGLLAVAGLLLAACGSSKGNAGSGSSGSSSAAGAGSSASGGAGSYAVDTSKCPAEATAKITGTVKIGATMPLSGGAAAAAFAPVAAGFKAYINYANEQNMVPGTKLELSIEDDQYKADLTTPAVEKLIDTTGVNIFAGIIGTPNNLAVRDTLNQECIPQLSALTGSPAWGNAAQYPWTIGGLPPYNVESQIYAESLKSDFPNGAKVAIFRVNNEFGQVYENSFKSLAGDNKLTIVDTQTQEAADSSPPTPQITSIASKVPDAILAAPLGAQCISFLKEVANAKAANPAFNPRIYITNTCSSSLLIGLAGPAADGIYTTGALKDVNDPANQGDPAVQLMIQRLNSEGFTGDYGTAAAGWGTGESTVKAIAAAAKSPEGITRASILNAARTLDYHPPLFRSGIDIKLNGTQDPFAVESLQVIQYQAATKTFKDIGSVISKFEGKTKAS